MTHNLIAKIETIVDGTPVELIKDIKSISRISAEDTARRFFRKNNVPMSAVEKVEKDSIHYWISYAFPHVVTHVIAETPAAEVKIALTQDEANAKAVEIFNSLREQMTVLYTRWQDEKDHEDFEDYIAAIKLPLEKIGGTYESMTNRPFALKYGVSDFHYMIGRNKSGGFGFWTAKAE